MPHVQIPRALATILVAASCAGASALSAAPGKDNRAVERTQGSCSKVLTKAELESISGTEIADLANTFPGQGSPVTVDFTFDARGKARFFLIDGQGLNVKTGIQRVDPDTCEVLTKRTKAEFGDSGVSGSVLFLFRPGPEPWLQGTFTNLSKGRERLSPTFKLEWRGVRNLEPQIPSDPGTPGAPVPGVPAPATGFPIYLGGPNLLNGARANGKVWAVQHTNCDDHTVIQGGVSYRMCLAGEGDTSLTAFNVTPKKFDFKKDPIPQGWEWTPFACEPGSDGTVGCTAKGKYRGYDILSTITNLQVTPGTLNFGANINVRLLSTGGDVGFRAAGQIESLGF